MFTVGKLIELLSKVGISLTELKEGTPVRDPRHIEIPCPWELKGKILRKLSKASPEKEKELIEGVKLREEEGFIFVLPDSDKPVLHLYASFKDEAQEKRRLEEEKERLELWIRGQQ